MKTLLQTMGSGMRKRISLVSSEIVIPQVKEFEVSFESNLWNISVKTLTATIEGRHNLDNALLKVELGIWDMAVIQEPSDDEITWHDFGTFIIARDGYSYADNKNETSITKAYDLLVRSYSKWEQKDISLTFPASVKETVKAISEVIKIPLLTTGWNLDDHIIEEGKWSNNDYTYADALRHIAELCNVSILLEKDMLVVKSISTSIVDTINGGEKTMKNEKTWGPPNILNLSREPQHDNYPFPDDWDKIPKDKRVQLNFSDNQIIDKRREELAPIIFEQVSHVEYTPFEYTGFGYLTMNFGDYISFVDKDGNSYTSYITKGKWTAKTGFQEMLGSTLTPNAQEDYVVFTDRRREGLKVLLKVDQQSGEIASLVKQVGDRADKETSLTQDVDSIVATVSEMNTEASIIPNANGALDYFGWTFGAANKGVKWGDLYRWYDYQSWGANFVPVEVHSLSKTGLKFVSRGTAITSAGYVVPDTTYSFKAKRHLGTQRFKLNILEYDKEMTQIKSTTFDFKNPNMYEVATIQPAQNTMYARLEYDILDDNDLILTEIMFNRGEPTSFKETADDVRILAETQFKITTEMIESTVKDITMVDGKVQDNSSSIVQLANQLGLNVSDLTNNLNTTVKITPSAGVEIWNNSGSGLTVYEGEKKTVELRTNGTIRAINAEFVDATITGNLNAGSIGNLRVQSNGIHFPNGKLSLRSDDNSINVGSIKIQTNQVVVGSSNIDVMSFLATGTQQRIDFYAKPTGLGMYGLNEIGSNTGTLNIVGSLDVFNGITTQNMNVTQNSNVTKNLFVGSKTTTDELHVIRYGGFRIKGEDGRYWTIDVGRDGRVVAWNPQTYP